MSKEETRQGKEYLITISVRQNKIVKFIDNFNLIKVQKIFINNQKNPEEHMLILTQLHKIKQYVAKRYDYLNIFQIEQMMKLEEKHIKGGKPVIKVYSEFYEIPTIYEYFKGITYKQSHAYLESSKLFIYYIEELFQLILGSGGIPNFFYLPNNIYIRPYSDKAKAVEIGQLKLNITSIAGLRLLHNENSTLFRVQFIELYPVLPPNLHKLIKQGNIDKLNLIIKIRCFAYNILLFILKRVPDLLVEIKQPQISIWDPQIRKKIENSPITFSKLLSLEAKTIEKAEKNEEESTFINFAYLLKRVLVDNDINHWTEVYEIVFIKNYYNRGSYQRRLIPDPQYDSYRLEQIQSNRIASLVWETEDQQGKEYWKKLGIATQNGGELYLLIKLNCSFHRLLRYLNIVEFFKHSRFSPDAQKISLKLLHLLTKSWQKKNKIEKNISYDRQQVQHFVDNILKIQKLKSLNAQKQTPKQTPQFEDVDIFNFSIMDKQKNQIQKASEQKGLFMTPVSLLSGVSNYLVEKDGKEWLSSSKYWSGLGVFQNSLWLA